VADEEKRDSLTQGTAIAVFVVVVVLIAIVLISLRIPHALRPSIQQAPVTTVVTVTPTG
jgi:hypothetical protein